PTHCSIALIMYGVQIDQNSSKDSIFSSMIMSLLAFCAMERRVSSKKVTRASQVDTHHGLSPA
uniref:Uncharacterized protein n=1 Tax=Aegilops tauschii subsp. strangulata TaxID=200361 RepID=A0A453KLE9_AEGTS